MHQKQKYFLGFTLVELIVVITIVGILSTVGFVSYSGYLSGARDSNRISQMVKLSDSLQVYSTTKTLPLPDDYVEITASGASNVIAYQGEVGVDVLETIDYTNGGADPKDDSYYTYYLTKDRRSMQLMAMMEEQQSVAQINPLNINSSYANDYTDRFPKVYGRKLGILTQEITNTPVQQLSVFDSTDFDVTTEIGYMAHISDEEKITGTVAGDLSASNPKGSCNRIKQTGGGSGNGEYTINPNGVDIEAYCNMEIAGGGWTLVARSVLGSTITDFGWNHTVGDLNNDNGAYSMGIRSLDIGFQDVILTGYNDGKNIDNFAIRVPVTREELVASVSYTPASTCKKIFDNGKIYDNRTPNIAVEACSVMNRLGTINNYGIQYNHNNLLSRGMSSWSYVLEIDEDIPQGMIFVK